MISKQVSTHLSSFVQRKKTSTLLHFCLQATMQSCKLKIKRLSVPRDKQYLMMNSGETLEAMTKGYLYQIYMGVFDSNTDVPVPDYGST